MEKSNPSAAALANRPRTRQRAYKAPPQLDVPDIDQDAAERKRVLNVLAQRARKRQNRRAGANAEKNGLNGEEPQETATLSSPLVGQEADAEADLETVSLGQGTSNGDDTLNLSTWNPLDDSIVASLLADPVPEMQPREVLEDPALDTGSDLVDFLDESSSALTWSSGETPGLSSSESGFPDSYLLPVHELTTLRALLRIAERLGCREQMWSLDALSPFNSGSSTSSGGLSIDKLPSAWQPTTSQLLIPHHPIMDFLPWPGTRDRIISMFALPDEARPPHAAGPLALVNFAYDLEDSAEGVRIYGGDPYDGSCWEVGQVLFERWWFLFDRDIIDNSNRWRLLRGAPPLLLKGKGSGSG